MEKISASFKNNFFSVDAQSLIVLYLCQHMSNIQYKINEFAKILGITPKALRLYEKMRLLVPDFIDAKTRYRYYSSKQLRDAALIIQLKNIGFSLNDIKKYLNNTLSLAQKRQMLIEKKHTIDNMLTGLEYIDTAQTAYSVYIKTECQVAVATKEIKVDNYAQILQIYKDFADLEVVPNQRLIIPDYFVAEFLDGDYREENVSALLKIGIVPRKGDACCVVPAQTYITTIHKGGYDTLYKAYDFLKHYMEIYQIAPAGNPSERYFESYEAQKSTDDYLTEVRYPICEHKADMIE